MKERKSYFLYSEQDAVRRRKEAKIAMWQEITPLQSLVKRRARGASFVRGTPYGTWREYTKKAQSSAEAREYMEKYPDATLVFVGERGYLRGEGPGDVCYFYYEEPQVEMVQ